MLIRTLTRSAGRLNWQPNTTQDVPDVDARELIRTGQAVAVEPQAAAKAAAPEAAPVVEPVAKKPNRKHK